MNRQMQSRAMGERRAALSLRALLCGVFIWLRGMTSILPVCGVSAWWSALLCLLPGIAAAGAFHAAMRWTRTSTVTEAVRACLGKVAAAGFSILLAVLLLIEGISTLTALLAVFTQGVGTKGTQFTLAALTGAMLCCCLHRDGLPRAVYLLRWGMLGLAAVLAISLAGDVQVSSMFPVNGDSIDTALSAWRRGYSLGWPFVLLLTVPACGARRRLSGSVYPAAAALGVILLTVLTIPHEVLMRRSSLAQWLLLPVWYQPNAIRVAGLCLLMLSFFLALGGAVQLASAHLLAPWTKAADRLPHVVLVGLVLTQAADIQSLWALLSAAEELLLLPLGVVAVGILPAAFCRRNKA